MLGFLLQLWNGIAYFISIVIGLVIFKLWFILVLCIAYTIYWFITRLAGRGGKLHLKNSGNNQQ